MLKTCIPTYWWGGNFETLLNVITLATTVLVSLPIGGEVISRLGHFLTRPRNILVSLPIGGEVISRQFHLLEELYYAQYPYQLVGR